MFNMSVPEIGQSPPTITHSSSRAISWSGRPEEIGTIPYPPDEEKQSRLARLRNATVELAPRFGAAAAGIALCASGGGVLMENGGKSDVSIGPIEGTAGLSINPKVDDHWRLPLTGTSQFSAGKYSYEFDTHSIGPTYKLAPTGVDETKANTLLHEYIIQSAGDPSTTPEEFFKEDASPDVHRIEQDKYAIAGRSMGAFTLGALGTGLLLYGVLKGVSVYERRKLPPALRAELPVSRVPESFAFRTFAGATALIVGTTALSATPFFFDRTALSRPQYSSELQALDLGSDPIKALNRVNRNSLANVDAYLALLDALRKVAEEESGLPTITYRIVNKSDEHRGEDEDIVNPLITAFGADGLISNGDTVDIGTEGQNEEITAQYLLLLHWLAGNHDSDETAKYIASLPNVNAVGKGQLMKWTFGNELTQPFDILAVGDPDYTPRAYDAPSPDRERVVQETIDELAQAYEAGTPYKGFATHDFSIFKDVDFSQYGVKFVLAGHTHEQATETLDGGVWHVNPGTVSGAGLRVLKNGGEDASDTPHPRTANILNFDCAGNPQSVYQFTFSSITSPSDTRYSTYTVPNPNYDPSEAEVCEPAEDAPDTASSQTVQPPNAAKNPENGVINKQRRTTSTIKPPTVER